MSGDDGLISLTVEECDWVLNALYEHLSRPEIETLYVRLVEWRSRHTSEAAS